VKQFLMTVAGVFVGLILFLIIGPIILVSSLMSQAGSPPPMPSAMVLSLDLREGLSDQPASAGGGLFGGGPNLLETLAALDAAGDDRRVRGLFIRGNTTGMPGAQAQELADAIEAFEQSGKFVIAHMQYDGIRSSMAGYLAASPATEIWLQEVGEVMPMGLTAEVDFFGATLERFRVTAQVEAREEYKTFANIFTEEGFTDAHEEETRSLLDGLYGTMAEGIALYRGITPEQVRSAVEATPMSAARGLELGLFTHTGRPEDAERAAVERGGDGAELVDFEDYYPREHGGSRPVIAVVQGEGEIISGLPDDGLFANVAMNSDTVARALLDAAEDEDVLAIVFRVSSPGGSVVASDQILHALRYAREQGKRVVVSMGDVAASGGYYVSVEADEIVANSATITGSIGVVGARIAIGGAMEEYLSVQTEAVSVGSPLHNWFTASRPFTEQEAAAFSGMIDRMYGEFMGLVAAGRGLTAEQTREVARGRVWTGAQARERQLVDHLGGFRVAVARAKALANVGEDQEVELRFFPMPLTPIEEFQEFLGIGGTAAQGLVRLSAVFSDPRVARAMAIAAQEQTPAQARAATPDVR
jgi:protease IV